MSADKKIRGRRICDNDGRMKLNKVILYDEPTVPEIQIKRQKDFLESTLPVTVEIANNFFLNLRDQEYGDISGARVLEPKRPFKKLDSSLGDILHEKGYSNSPPADGPEAVMYDGFELQRIASEIIAESGMDTLHIVFTSRLIATFSEEDFRYHARTMVGSNPTIVSTTGMVEAPAKPRQYYVDLMAQAPGSDTDEIRRRYEGQFLEYHDPRLSAIVEGCLLQAAFYLETGDAFCHDKRCRLFNSHWQRDLLESQLYGRMLCDRHRKELERLCGTGDAAVH